MDCSCTICLLSSGRKFRKGSVKRMLAQSHMASVESKILLIAFRNALYFWLGCLNVWDYVTERTGQWSKPVVLAYIQKTKKNLYIRLSLPSLLLFSTWSVHVCDPVEILVL